MRDKKDWNYDRFHTALALIFDVQNDMMRCVNAGEVNGVVRRRMVRKIELVKEQIENAVLCHD